MRKSVEKCQTYTKIETIFPSIGDIFSPQFETFLPLKSLSCQFYIAKKPFRIIEYLQQWTVLKNAQLAHVGFPYLN